MSDPVIMCVLAVVLLLGAHAVDGFGDRREIATRAITYALVGLALSVPIYVAVPLFAGGDTDALVPTVTLLGTSVAVMISGAPLLRPPRAPAEEDRAAGPRRESSGAGASTGEPAPAGPVPAGATPGGSAAAELAARVAAPGTSRRRRHRGAPTGEPDGPSARAESPGEPGPTAPGSAAATASAPTASAEPAAKAAEPGVAERGAAERASAAERRRAARRQAAAAWRGPSGRGPRATDPDAVARTPTARRQGDELLDEVRRRLELHLSRRESGE